MRGVIITFIAIIFMVIIVSVVLRGTGYIVDVCTLPTGETVRGAATISDQGWSVWTNDGRLLHGFGQIQCETGVSR